MVLRTACCALALVLVSPAASASSERSRALNQELGLADGERVEVSLEGAAGGRSRLHVALDGAPFALDLAPHSVRAEGFELIAVLADGSRVNQVVTPPRTVRGTIAGQAQSRVAGSLLDGGFVGRILTESGDEWWLQPAPDGAGQHVLYRTADVVDDGLTSCGGALLANNQPQIAAPVQGGAAQLGSLSRAELGCDADYEYYLDHGSSTTQVMDRIESLINTMNVQYETEVAITHDITAILVQTSAAQPYTSTDPSTLLGQFRDQWVVFNAAVLRDVAHLFTGKSLDGNVIGVAFLGVICNPTLGYGLVESDFNGNFACATDLSAHELGHNWNSDHCSCPGNTMNPSITCANTFSTVSRDMISAHRDASVCLDTGGPGPQVLFADDFESGDFTTGGWTLQNNRPRVRPAAARSSNFGARIRRSSWIEREVSTAGFSTVRVSYARRTRNLDAGEFYVIEYFDGVGYNTIELLSSNGGWIDHVNVELPASAANNPNFRLRARCSADQGRERGDLDNVEVIGVP